MTSVDGVDEPGAPVEQDPSEAPGRCPAVEANPSIHHHAEPVEGRGQLGRAPQGSLGPHHDGRPGPHLGTGVVDRPAIDEDEPGRDQAGRINQVGAHASQLLDDGPHPGHETFWRYWPLFRVLR